MAISVSIVEDHHGIRESLTASIDGADGFVLLDSYETGEEALQGVPKETPDVVLMDINLPNMSGVECVRKLKAQLPNLQVIMLTVYDDEDLLFNSLAAGATGYLLKRSSRTKILNAIREVYHGGAPMSAQIARMVVGHFHAARKASDTSSLTQREMEILAQLAKGYRYKEIADALNISFDTVRSHIRHIYEKLHVQSRTEAVVKYLNR